MIGMGILAPVVALAAWTMVMWLWMYATRIPAMKKAGMLDDAAAANTKDKIEQGLPANVQWKAHNYNHLHEAPTVFYAVAIVLAIIGHGDGMNLWLGWAYVILRIIHSLVQSTFNAVPIRFGLFILSTLVLIALIFHAAIPVFDIHM